MGSEPRPFGVRGRVVAGVHTADLMVAKEVAFCRAVTIRKSNAMERRYKRCNDRGTSAIEWCYQGREKDCSPSSEDQGSQGKTAQRKDLQKETLPQWQSALK